MLTAETLRAHIAFLRQWDPEYARYAQERMVRNLPWLLKGAV